MKRPMPCAGDTIHVDGEEIGRMRGYPHRWSAKVLAVIDDREVSGTKIGPLPRKT